MDCITSCFLCLLAYKKHAGSLTACLVDIILTSLSSFFLNTNLKVDFLPFKSRHFLRCCHAPWDSPEETGPLGGVPVLQVGRQRGLLGAFVLFDQLSTSLWSGREGRSLQPWGPPTHSEWEREMVFSPRFGWEVSLQVRSTAAIFLSSKCFFKEDKKRSYVSACNFKFKRTPGPSAEVDSDIWYSHQEAGPGAGGTAVLASFSAYSTLCCGYQSIPTSEEQSALSSPCSSAHWAFYKWQIKERVL